MPKNALKLAEKFIKEMKGEITSQGGNFSCYSYGSILPLGFTPYIDRYYSFDFVSFLYFSEDKYGGVFFNLPIYQQTTQETYKNLLRFGAENVREFNGYVVVTKNIQELYDSCDPFVLVDKDNEYLLNILNRAVDLEAELFVTTVYSESIDEKMIRSMYDSLKTKKTDFDIFLKMATKPAFESFVARYDRALLSVFGKDDYYSAQWVFSNYYITPDISEIKSKTEIFISEKGGIDAIKKELKKLSDEIKEQTEQTKSFRVGLSKDEQVLFDYVHRAMEARDSRKVPLQQTLTILNNIARILFIRGGLPTDDFIFSFPQELISNKYLEKGYAEELNKRKDGVIVYYNKDGWVISTEDYAATKKYIYDSIDKIGVTAKEFKGNIGCKGHAKAKVLIVLNEKDFSKFIPGSVLVTSMTRPEFVPLMKKAAAIVTDEGGVTCHAAIVSRELNIPCIIGTKNATRILKDGDMVEVDAEKGVVRILEK
jgi:phosphohistidine swiveling domain-containing protein